MIMVFEKVKAIVAEKLDIDPSLITMESSFSEMQIDSLYMVEIMLALEDEFGIMIDDAGELLSIADLVAYVEKKIG